LKSSFVLSQENYSSALGSDIGKERDLKEVLQLLQYCLEGESGLPQNTDCPHRDKNIATLSLIELQLQLEKA
jgi:hypothetical protein